MTTGGFGVPSSGGTRPGSRQCGGIARDAVEDVVASKRCRGFRKIHGSQDPVAESRSIGRPENLVRRGSNRA